MIDDDERIRMASFDAGLLPRSERLAGFDALSPGYDKILPDGTTPEDFTCECRAWLLGDLAISSNVFTAIDIKRTPAHIAAYARDTVTLTMCEQGRWSVELETGRVEIGTGEIGVIDFSVPWRVSGTAQRNIMMVVPRAALAGVVPELPDLHGKILGGSSGRLLAEHLSALVRHLSELRRSDTGFVRNATIALLGNAVAALPGARPAPPRRTPRTVPPARIRSFIEAHLTDPGLGAPFICTRLGVTRPTLYRALQPHGGVSHYIKQRRLEAAHARLSGSGDGTRLHDIADLYGFSSPAHFSTAFRRQFGFTPSRARGLETLTGDAASLFQSWHDTLPRLTLTNLAA